MRLTRQSRACPILVAGFIALGACMPTDPPTSARTSPSRSPTPPQPAETAVETKVIERRLNFVQGAGTRGALRYQIPYGRGPGHVYFADYCVPPEDCAPPCPCEVPAVPTAFDIDDKSRLWVYDTASARLAVFGPDGSWRFAVALGEIGYRGGDIQIVGEDAVALTQDDESRAVGIRIDSDGTVLGRTHIELDGEPIDLYRLAVFGTRAFGAAFAGSRLSEYETFIEVFITDEDPLRAQEAEGWPTPTGTLLFPDFAGDTLIPLEVDGPEPWSREVHFDLRQKFNGRWKTKNGVVSWGDIEIDHEGAIHLIVSAGTFGKEPRGSYYWYLKAGPDGTVGRPIRLREPDRDDGGQQLRRLTLDADGEPFAMWTEQEGLVIESLVELETQSLPE